MGTRYVSVPKKFDIGKWAKLIEELMDLFDSSYEAGRMAGVHATTLLAWRDKKYTDGFEHPNMSNFVRICNLMDVDPSDYFTWE